MREPGELDRVWSDKTIFIMTPEEAIKEAARSGQALWLDQLCTRYECRVPSALVAAAAHSHLGAKGNQSCWWNGHLCDLKRLMSVLFTPARQLDELCERHQAVRHIGAYNLRTARGRGGVSVSTRQFLVGPGGGFYCVSGS
ncbi:hypothetical protein PC116_g18148 [Phytophthora cactorum]|nr:hypothetical protein PC111_g15265 [Phytophthora cactorum]KAG2815099.1 hypothetical protein PC112_g14032 [Phytophthora cactorum]KAG3150087.1 hypothetical protein C6341_g16863 [Phytophthora cactorum]KAG3175529.1 hypothetical protein PC128_g17671 [Phytophthora cactorum]KAG4233651.1 hypothetical protein PC116_g18148 [Phytophthora cactorum]